MRKISLLFMLLPLFFGCAPKEKQGVSLTGLIENPNKDFFVLGGPGGSRDSVYLDSTGNFTCELPNLTEGALYYFIFDNNNVEYLHLTPGMELDYYADMDNFTESRGFTGKGSDINNYLAGKDPRAFNYDWYSLDENAFRFKADSLMAAQQADLNTAEKDDPDDPFWKTEKGDVLFSWANHLENYPDYHGYYAKISDFKVGDNWYDFRKELDFNESGYIHSREFNQYLASMMRRETSLKMKEMIAKDSTLEVDRKLMTLKIAAKLLTNETVLNNYLYHTVTGYMQWGSLSDIPGPIDFFYEQVKDTALVAKFNSEYEAWKRLDKGEPMIDFSGEDLNGNRVQSTDFRGKYLYVDVWATWCGPCVYEVPFLKKLEADYHDRNIVFLSYSIDEDKDAWLKYVPEHQLSGVHLRGERGWQSKLCKDYKVSGVPTFLFFDPEGKIINVKMTRPSDPRTRDTFNAFKDL